jgi:hypothetical protein
MKVIKKPELDGWTTEVTCKCTAVLEVSLKDISSSYHSGSGHYTDQSYYNYHVKCPICKDHVSVVENSMTEAVKVHLQNKAKSSYSSCSYWDK